MTNGQTVADRLNGSGKGLPWMTILDATGKELVNSDSSEGNIGCPVSEGEQAYFMSMLKQTAQRTSDDTLNELAEALRAYAATL